MWVPDNSEATVQDKANPRLYKVETAEVIYRQNRGDLIQLPEQSTQEVKMPAEQPTLPRAGVGELFVHQNDTIQDGMWC